MTGDVRSNILVWKAISDLLDCPYENGIRSQPNRSLYRSMGYYIRKELKHGMRCHELQDMQPPMNGSNQPPGSATRPQHAIPTKTYRRYSKGYSVGHEMKDGPQYLFRVRVCRADVVRLLLAKKIDFLSSISIPIFFC